MPRVLRSLLGDGTFHVWCVAVDGTPAFFDDVDRVAFLRLFGECVSGFEWEPYAWCLMTTHYHLVVAAKQERLSAGMQRLNGVHAQRVNRRRRRAGHARVGHVFRDRFSSRVVEGDERLRAVCRYVLLNPVRAGLVERPEDWPWSGSRWSRTP